MEFALLLPILLSVALLCVDYGRLASYYIAVTNSAAAAAAYGSLNMPPTSSQGMAQWQAAVTQVAKDAIPTSYLSNFSVEPPQFISEGGGYWRVSVTTHYSFQTLIRWTGWSNNGQTDLHRTVVMRGTL